jgi:hypothetical protein
MLRIEIEGKIVEHIDKYLTSGKINYVYIIGKRRGSTYGDKIDITGCDQPTASIFQIFGRFEG